MTSTIMFCDLAGNLFIFKMFAYREGGKYEELGPYELRSLKWTFTLIDWW